MKLTTMTQVSLDGVTQGNGGASAAERADGFTRGGWALGRGDDSTRELIAATYQHADAFLFGRRTFEVFAASWGSVEQMRAHPIGEALAAKPKYVASRSFPTPEWANSTVLSGDLAAAIAALKADSEGELQVHGSAVLVQWLLQHDLVDELRLLTIPVIVGQGRRLFPDAGPDIALDVVESRTDSKGVTYQVLRPIGRPQYPAL